MYFVEETEVQFRVINSSNRLRSSKFADKFSYETTSWYFIRTIPYYLVGDNGTIASKHRGIIAFSSNEILQLHSVIWETNFPRRKIY